MKTGYVYEGNDWVQGGEMITSPDKLAKIAAVITACISLTLVFSLSAQEKVVWSDKEKPIVEQIRGLRKLDDTVRARVTKELALQIRQLPVVPNHRE